MLIEFKVTNYRSFKEEQTLSFVAARDTTHPDNLIRVGKTRLLKACAIFGANASGKSNLVHALQNLSLFVRDSVTRLAPDTPIALADPFRLDAELAEQPSRFSVSAIHENRLYTYTLAVSRHRVQEETLSVGSPASAKSNLLFSRRFHAETEEESYEFGALPKSTHAVLRERTRRDALALAVGTQFNVRELEPIFTLLSRDLLFYDLSQQLENLVVQATELLLHKPEWQEIALRMMQDADTGIEQFVVSTASRESRALLASKIPPTALLQHIALHPTLSESEILRISTLRTRNDGKEIRFDFLKDESLGTQRFYAVMVLFLAVLEAGTTLILDELDCSLHANLTFALVELFQSPEANPHGAQLLFTTHDIGLFNQGLLRRDQIWLTEKNDHATELYSLADFTNKPRNVASFLRNYVSGRYGGIPQLGQTFVERRLIA